MRSQRFALTDPLPAGRMLLEASAGTGKTYSIAALVTRYVAEQDVPISRILVVTFTKAAAAELRDRIRGRLAHAAEALRQILAGEVLAAEDDAVLLHLTSGSHVELSERFRRIERSLAEFDTATIGTIHSFAQTLLSEQGVAATTNPDATLTEDTTVVVEEALADVLARRGTQHLPVVDPKTVVDAAQLALKKPDSVLSPTRAEIDTARATRRSKDFLESADALAESADVVAEVVNRVTMVRRNRAVLSFDDILIAARELVTNPRSGQRAVAEVRSRIDVALIDEFQDTDGTQWEMLDALFGKTEATLITVGDPKQSIYRFRGADIKAYLASSDSKDAERFTLGTNFRSDPVLLAGTERLFEGTTFGDPRIGFEPVMSGKKESSPLLVRGHSASGVELRAFSNSRIPAEPAKEATGADIARLVVEHLEHGQVPHAGGHRAIQPGDIAVLVRSHGHVDAIHRSLTQAGVPVVIGNVGSVMSTEAASQLFALLQAVAAPARPRLVRAAALGWFCHKTWEELDGIEPDQPGAGVVADLQVMFSEWAEVLQKEGLPAFFDRIWQYKDVAVRLLESGQGERSLTDLNHIRELLESDGSSQQVHRLVERMEQLMTDVEEDADAELFARRTDSDDDAVQIMTVHAAKGLEFPIAIAVGLGAAPTNRRPTSFDQPDGTRTVIFGAAKAWERKDLDPLIKDEEKAEQLRLIYVAVTRAIHKSVVYLGSKPGDAPLSRLLFKGKAPATGEGVMAALQPRVIESDGAFRVTVIDENCPPARWLGATSQEAPVLRVATIDRVFDRDPQRWSFTRISGKRIHPGDHTESGSSVALQDVGPEQGATDEATPDGLTVDDSDAQGSPLPLGNIAGGAAFGTMVHGVLEAVDFAAPNLQSELATHVGNAVAWSNWKIDPAELTHGLVSAIDTPLGPLFDNRPMRSFDSTNVLDEMTFELPLAPSVPPGRRPTGTDVGQLILAHLPPVSPLRKWAEQLANNAINVNLAGHLTGAIDGIFRVSAEGRHDRYVVVDYKTNRLGAYGSPLVLHDYSQANMATAMAHHDYPLQALLYAVALHRYLRWRLGDTYDPATNLGGAAYLFVRGMIGPETPPSGSAVHGVFSWPIPPELVVGLSDLLHHGQRIEAVG
ncbi:MAG: UvrD-helicase domain-containing protein [Acidimicrobiales bacterium]|nr:UvrD-helicase domain-containing protein [Acidimicrobiales bacterium]